MTQQLISSESFTSVQEAQAGLTKLFKYASKKNGFYRVLRNNRSLGVLIPNKVWDKLLEDLEALSSPEFISLIAKSRATLKRYSAKETKLKLKL